MAENTVSIPAFERTITLSSIHSQKLFDRTYRRTSQALYNSDVMVRIVAGTRDAEQLEEVVHALIDEVERELSSAFDSRSAELEKHGITSLPSYNSPQDHTLRVSSPHVGRFIQILILFDEYVKQTDALWLMGALTNGQRDREAYAWQKRINRFSSRLIQLESRAMRSAQRQARSKQDSEKVDDSNSEEDKPAR